MKSRFLLKLRHRVRELRYRMKTDSWVKKSVYSRVKLVVVLTVGFVLYSELMLSTNGFFFHFLGVMFGSLVLAAGFLFYDFLIEEDVRQEHEAYLALVKELTSAGFSVSELDGWQKEKT